MSIKVFYHSADLDGWCSGAIVKYKYPEAEMFPINYGDKFPWEEIKPDDDVVYMVDFSLPANDMEKLARYLGLKECKASQNFFWIDHHKGIIDEMEKKKTLHDGVWIRGYQQSGTAACELTWRYLYGNDNVPKFIKLLGEYDVGKFLKEFIPSQEIFLPVKGFETLYSVSTFGNIRTERTGELMSPSYNNSGYLQVILSKEGKTKPKQIHSLVAETFLVQPEGCREVNHIDGNRSNNILSNLEWCNRRLNTAHALRTGLKHCIVPYYGISYQTARDTYHARVSCYGSREMIGTFKDAESAAEAYDAFIISKNLHKKPYYLPLNFSKSEKPERKTIFYNPRSEVFQYGMKLEDANPKKNWKFWKEWIDLAKNPEKEENWIDLTCINGSHIISYNLLDSFKIIKDRSYKIDWEGYKCLVINSDPYIANFMTRSNEFEGCDIAINYANKRGEGWIVNLRTLKNDVDLSELAKKYKGGGHKGSAGFNCKMLPWENKI